MATVFVRLLLIYFLTILSMRLMGKRQIAQMQMGELVCAFFLSELAAYPVTNQNVPLSYGIIPVVTLICLEVLLSFLSTKWPALRSLLDAAPNPLIRKGHLDRSELARARLSVPELISMLRLKDVTDVGEVDYALLEPSGEISVIKKGEGGLQHLLVSDGRENEKGLRAANMTSADLRRRLSEKNLKLSDVFLLCVNDEGQFVCFRKEEE